MARRWRARLDPDPDLPRPPQVLSWWGFSDEFAYEMVFPLTALFFGTGNQTPYVSAAVVARVFLDPQLRWACLPACLPACPPACPPASPAAKCTGAAPVVQTFPVLSQAAAGRGALNVCLPQAGRGIWNNRRQDQCHDPHWCAAEAAPSRYSAEPAQQRAQPPQTTCLPLPRLPHICAGAKVDKVVRSGGKVHVTDTAGTTAEYEEVVFACGAEEALRVLDAPSWCERGGMQVHAWGRAPPWQPRQRAAVPEALRQ